MGGGERERGTRCTTQTCAVDTGDTDCAVNVGMSMGVLLSTFASSCDNKARRIGSSFLRSIHIDRPYRTYHERVELMVDHGSWQRKTGSVGAGGRGEGGGASHLLLVLFVDH